MKQERVFEHFAGKTDEEGISDAGKLPSNNKAKERWIIVVNALAAPIATSAIPGLGARS